MDIKSGTTHWATALLNNGNSGPIVVISRSLPVLHIAYFFKYSSWFCWKIYREKWFKGNHLIEIYLKGESADVFSMLVFLHLKLILRSGISLSSHSSWTIFPHMFYFPAKLAWEFYTNRHYAVQVGLDLRYNWKANIAPFCPSSKQPHLFLELHGRCMQLYFLHALEHLFGIESEVIQRLKCLYFCDMFIAKTACSKSA